MSHTSGLPEWCCVLIAPWFWSLHGDPILMTPLGLASWGLSAVAQSLWQASAWIPRVFTIAFEIWGEEAVPRYLLHSSCLQNWCHMDATKVNLHFLEQWLQLYLEPCLGWQRNATLECGEQRPQGALGSKPVEGVLDPFPETILRSYAYGCIIEGGALKFSEIPSRSVFHCLAYPFCLY